MRSLLLVCMLCALAHADPPISQPPLPVDGVSKAKVGDWAVYEGWRLAEGGLVRDRVAVRVVKPAGAKSPIVVWSRGEPDHEVEFYRYVASGPPSTGLVDTAGVKGTLAVATTTCKLADEIGCAQVTYATTADQTIVLKMASAVRATGIVYVDVEAARGVTWELNVVAYGTAVAPEWTEPVDARISGLTGDPPADGFGVTGGSPEPPIDLAIGALKVSAGLDKAIVQRYLRRNRQKLFYCYEKAKLAKPDVARRGAATFAIGSDGRVASASATGIDDTGNTCVADVIKAIEFPKPTGDQPITASFTYTIQEAK